MTAVFQRRRRWAHGATAHLLVFITVVLQAAAVQAVLTGHRVLAAMCVVAAALHFASPAFWAGRALAERRFDERLATAVAEARKDPLTGLPNRAVADDMLAAATAAGTPMTIALIDVTGLHMINGNLGHAAGDQYLTLIARRLTRAVPRDGALVRQGGDEFTLLAPHTDQQELADRIGAAMAGPAVIAGYRMQPRAAVGIAATGGPGRVDAGHARARADMALYTAKRDGGQQIRLFDPARDPEPAPDGTRPLLRRRDLPPAAGTAPWAPAPGDDLVPLLLTPDEIRAIMRLLADTVAEEPVPGAVAPPAANGRLTELLQRLQPIAASADPHDQAGSSG